MEQINFLQSYHDLAVRLEPIILELEREKDDLLIIAHESVLRVLYGYLMACDAMAIPKLKFPRNEIIEVSSIAYTRFLSSSRKNRSFLPAIRMRQSGSISLDFHKKLSQVLLRISEFLSHPVA
jgi:broad specificity phosphatase PhoE